MASYTYPVPVNEGRLSPEQIHALLSNPALLARRVADLTKQKFIADYLLTGRYDATGGGIYYDTGEEIFAADEPEQVAPGAEYPKTVMTTGEIESARTVKWGLETVVTDERIARLGMDSVNKALARLANTVIRHVDQVAWGVISSKVTSTVTSEGWDTPGKMLRAIKAAQDARSDLGTGLDLSTVVLPSAAYAEVLGMLVDSGALPRESGNVVLTGAPISAFGLEWVTSPYVTGTDPWLIDRTALGGVGDENLRSPGYASASNGNVEVRTDRHRDDKYEVRARRVCVPVVLEPLAGVRITGTGLS